MLFVALCSNTSDELPVAYKLYIVPWHPSDQVNKLAFSKKSPQRPGLCSCHSLPFRKLFLPSAAKPTFQDSGSISWFPFLCFHSTLYLPSSQLSPHYTEIIYLCVCLPSYSKIPRGQGTCLTHLQTPRQNVAQQSRNTELNCNQSGWPPHCPECILLTLNSKLCSHQHLDNPTNDLGHSLQAQVSQGGLVFKP